MCIDKRIQKTSAFNRKEENTYKSIEIELLDGEYFMMYVPNKTCVDHFYYLLNLTTIPEYNGNVIDDLMLAFPSLTEMEAIKIHALFLLFADPRWEVKR